MANFSSSSPRGKAKIVADVQIDGCDSAVVYDYVPNGSVETDYDSDLAIRFVEIGDSGTCDSYIATTTQAAYILKDYQPSIRDPEVQSNFGVHSHVSNVEVSGDCYAKSDVAASALMQVYHTENGNADLRFRLNFTSIEGNPTETTIPPTSADVEMYMGVGDQAGDEGVDRAQFWAKYKDWGGGAHYWVVSGYYYDESGNIDYHYAAFATDSWGALSSNPTQVEFDHYILDHPTGSSNAITIETYVNTDSKADIGSGGTHDFTDKKGQIKLSMDEDSAAYMDVQAGAQVVAMDVTP